MMTPKLKAIISGSGAGVAGFLAFLANTPPSQQDGLLSALMAVLPVSARPEIAAIAKLLSEFALVYGIYQASHSGPATKPATDPQTGEAARLNAAIAEEPVPERPASTPATPATPHA